MPPGLPEHLVINLDHKAKWIFNSTWPEGREDPFLHTPKPMLGPPVFLQQSRILGIQESSSPFFLSCRQSWILSLWSWLHISITMIHTSASSAEIKALFLLHLVKKSHFQAKQVRKIEVATQSSETEKKFMFGISLLPQVAIIASA